MNKFGGGRHSSQSNTGLIC